MKNRYFYINMSSSFKQLFFGLSLLCFLFAITVYFVDPTDPGVTLNLGGYSQGQVALFLVCIGSLLIPLYYLLARVFKSDYVADPSKDNQENWFK